MKSYEFFDKLLLRVPRFHKAARGQSLEEQLDNPAFRDAIYLASDSLYGELEKRNFKLGDGDERLRHALEKYRRRICYRSTPFGGFASVSRVKWSSGDYQGKLIISENSFHTKVLHVRSAGENAAGAGLFQVNPSIYAYGNNFRLYESHLQADRSERVFKLNEFNAESLPGP